MHINEKKKAFKDVKQYFSHIQIDNCFQLFTKLAYFY